MFAVEAPFSIRVTGGCIFLMLHTYIHTYIHVYSNFVLCVNLDNFVKNKVLSRLVITRWSGSTTSDRAVREAR